MNFNNVNNYQKQAVTNVQNALGTIFNHQQKQELVGLVRILQDQYWTRSVQLKSRIEQPEDKELVQIHNHTANRYRYQNAVRRQYYLTQKILRIKASFAEKFRFERSFNSSTKSEEIYTIQKIKHLGSDIKQKILQIRENEWKKKNNQTGGDIQIGQPNLQTFNKKPFEQAEKLAKGTVMKEIKDGALYMATKLKEMEHGIKETGKYLNLYGEININQIQNRR